MSKKWYVGYFYKGYLNQLINSFHKHEEFADVKMWYPMLSKVVVKDGKKEIITYPMFENYVLFEFEEDSLIWKEILRSTPVISFLKEGSRPVAIKDYEVEHIKNLEDKQSVVDYSSLINKRVMIIGGPFANFVGTCKSIIKNKYKARVYVEMFGVVERSLEINLEHLKPL